MKDGMLGLTPDAPLRVSHAPIADSLFAQYHAKTISRSDELERTPGRSALAQLWGRAHEHALRIAIIIAVCKLGTVGALEAGCAHLEIDLASAQWAIDFVDYTTRHMEREVEDRVGDSDMDREVLAVVAYIKKAGPTGRRPSDLQSGCRSFRALEPGIQDKVLEMIKRRGDARLLHRVGYRFEA